jgi:hypothetical protein
VLLASLPIFQQAVPVRGRKGRGKDGELGTSVSKGNYFVHVQKLARFANGVYLLELLRITRRWHSEPLLRRVSWLLLRRVSWLLRRVSWLLLRVSWLLLRVSWLLRRVAWLLRRVSWLLRWVSLLLRWVSWLLLRWVSWLLRWVSWLLRWVSWLLLRWVSWLLLRWVSWLLLRWVTWLMWRVGLLERLPLCRLDVHDNRMHHHESSVHCHVLRNDEASPNIRLRHADSSRPNTSDAHFPVNLAIGAARAEKALQTFHAVFVYINPESKAGLISCHHRCCGVRQAGEAEKI